jgi:hypothetical protein
MVRDRDVVWLKLPIDHHHPELASFSIATTRIQILDHHQIAAGKRGQRLG